MKTIYKIIQKIASKSTIGLFQNHKSKLGLLKDGVYIDESESLLSQLYSVENETLFI